MEKYRFKRKEKSKKIPSLYRNILFSVIIFGIITFSCRINPDLKNSVKNVLYNSYDMNLIKSNSIVYIDKCKEVINEIKSNLIQEE